MPGDDAEFGFATPGIVLAIMPVATVDHPRRIGFTPARAGLAPAKCVEVGAVGCAVVRAPDADFPTETCIRVFINSIGCTAAEANMAAAPLQR